MATETPHFLLFTEARGDDTPSWRFALEPVAGGQRVVAEDSESATPANRLELLAVVRGLEALDGSSRVTLVTRSRYVARGIQRGIREWRERNWRWERFGRWVPVRDHDLWQRVDRALRFHEVDCRLWRFDENHAEDNSDNATNACPAPHFQLPVADGVEAPPVAACEASNFGEPAVVIVRKPARAKRARRVLRQVADVPRRAAAAVGGAVHVALDPGMAHA